MLSTLQALGAEPSALTGALLLLATAAYLTYCRLTRISVAKVPGPPSTSWIHGNLPEFMNCAAAELDFKWQKMYGRIYRLRANFGQDYLIVSDPAAIQHVFQHPYTFIKHPERRNISKLFTGPGLGWVEGDDHKRQRKIMRPAFGSAETKALLPVFSLCASNLTTKWKEFLTASKDQTAIVDAPQWISRAALDAIGKAALDYEFDALEDLKNPLTVGFQNLLVDTVGRPTTSMLMSLTILQYIPQTVVDLLMARSKNPRVQRARDHGDRASQLAKELLATKLATPGGRDVMSLMVKANSSETSGDQLSEDEAAAQLMTLMLAGHETTANSLSWTLFELCKNPDMQFRLRSEIHDMQLQVKARGDEDLTCQDYDAMPYLNAVLKESLRFHPVASHLLRQADSDEVLPLSTPIIASTGREIHDLPVPKGQRFIMSIATYNRLTDIFGEDANTFNPERFLLSRSSKPGVSVGVYANLLTFSSGMRSCIGWKFAILELQVFLAELISSFEFSVAVPEDKIRREGGGIMVPVVYGEEQKGSQLPLRIKVVR